MPVTQRLASAAANSQENRPPAPPSQFAPADFQKFHSRGAKKKEKIKSLMTASVGTSSPMLRLLGRQLGRSPDPSAWRGDPCSC